MDNKSNLRANAGLGADTRAKYRAGLIATFGGVCSLAIVRVMAIYGFFDLFSFMSPTASELLTSLVWPVLGGAIVPFLLYFGLANNGRFIKRYSATNIKVGLCELGFGKVSVGIVLISILLGAVYAIANSGIAIVSQNVLIALGFRLGGGGSSELGGLDYLVAICITSAVMPALFEEFTCRGTLLKSLQKHGEIKAILFSAMIFGLFHMNLAQTIYTFAMGLITAFITIKLRSIWPAVIIHFVNNFGGTVLSYLYALNLPGKQFYDLFYNIAMFAPLLLLGIWVVAIGLSVMIVYGMMRYYKFVTEYKQYKLMMVNRREMLRHARQLQNSGEGSVEQVEASAEQVEVSEEQTEASAEQAEASEEQVEASAEATLSQVVSSEEEVELLYKQMQGNNVGESGNGQEASAQIPEGQEASTQIPEGQAPEVNAEDAGYTPKYIDKIWFYASIIVAGGATLYSIIWAII